MSFPLVMKFGGAALKNGPAVRRACEIVAEHLAETPIVIVSAHAGVTESLELCAREAAAGRCSLESVRIRHKTFLRELGLDPELLNRLLAELGQILYSISERRRIQADEMDFVLSLGERMSARIVAAALRQVGHASTPVDAFDLGLTTDSCHGQARPLPGVEASLRRSLSDIPGVPVITGFLAKDGSGTLTTMGRNGSDLTASLVAQAVAARRLLFWKGVPGLMSADPQVVKSAQVIPELSIREAEVMAFHGARVLHPSTLEPLRGGVTVLEVRDVRTPELAGSTLDNRDAGTQPIAVAGNRELVGLRALSEKGSVPANLFTLMHAHHVRPRFVHTTSAGVSVYAPPSSGFEILCRELGEHAESLSPLSSVVLVGGGGRTSGPLALDLFRDHGLEPSFVHLDSDGLGQVFLFERELREQATCLLHDESLTAVATGRR
ncbi:MAG: aspartate kinase [Planctomycetota bacterium]|jgi:aspartate kinase